MGWKSAEEGRAYNRAYRLKNLEKLRAQGREWSEANRDARREAYRKRADKNGVLPLAERRLLQELSARSPDAVRANDRARYVRNLKYRLVKQAEYRSKRRGLPFTLTVDSVDWVEVCPVFGVALDYTTIGRKGRLDNSPSLDRIVPDRGYTQENVRVISWRANHIKTDATAAELRLVLAYLEART